MTTSLNFPLFEQIKYSPSMVSQATIVDTLEDYSIIIEQLDNAGIDLDNLGNASSIEDQIEALVQAGKDKILNDERPDYALYKAFFDECFERLNAHYPCPSITSDYDQSVIFEAIQKGEETQNQELIDEVINLQKQLRQHIKFDVKKHYSLMVADSQVTKILLQLGEAE